MNGNPLDTLTEQQGIPSPKQIDKNPLDAMVDTGTMNPLDKIPGAPPEPPSLLESIGMGLVSQMKDIAHGTMTFLKDASDRAYRHRAGMMGVSGGAQSAGPVDQTKPIRTAD